MGKGPRRPGLQGLRAPLGPGLLRAARPSAAAGLPPGAGASYSYCHPRPSRGGERGMRGPPRSLAGGFPPLAAAGKPTRAGVWVTRGGWLCQSPFPGGPEGAVTPQELGWGKAAQMVRKDRPEPRERRRGGRGWASPTAGPRGVPCHQTDIQLLGCGTLRRAAGGEPRESVGCQGHSLGSARSSSREARNVLFDDLLSSRAVKNVPLK